MHRAVTWRNGVALMLAVGVLSCGGRVSTSTRQESNTNWLQPCDRDAQCGEELACACGTCTRSCEPGQCPDGLECVVVDGCSDVEPSCQRRCSSASDCAADGECRDGYCVAAAIATQPVDVPAAGSNEATTGAMTGGTSATAETPLAGGSGATHDDAPDGDSATTTPAVEYERNAGPLAAEVIAELAELELPESCDVVEQIFRVPPARGDTGKNCALEGACHGVGGEANGILLHGTADEIGARLLDQPSGTGECTGLYIDSRAPLESTLLLKTTRAHAEVCPRGTQMPTLPPLLSQEQTACLVRWVLSVAEAAQASN